MEPIEELAKELAFNEVKKLLVDLAINFSDKTKFLAVPIGTTQWTVDIYDNGDDPKFAYPNRAICIKLVHFFGMYVGYNSELDLLVMWNI